MLNFDIQSHRPLREIVYEELRDLILKGEIKPGTRMMEIELAEDMGVSRTPIREAIRKLEKEGLVTIEPRRGAYVSDVSVKDMVDILEVRSTLEGLAAYLASKRMTRPEQLELLETSQRFNEALKAGDMALMIKCDTKFHHLMFEASRNKHLIQMVEALQELVLRFRYIYYKDFKRAEEMPVEHMRIYEAIASGEAELARTSAYNHIDQLKEMILRDDIFNN
jgi:DNA-binding GntR family transcriptional regulator